MALRPTIQKSHSDPATSEGEVNRKYKALFKNSLVLLASLFAFPMNDDSCPPSGICAFRLWFSHGSLSPSRAPGDQQLGNMVCLVAFKTLGPALDEGWPSGKRDAFENRCEGLQFSMKDKRMNIPKIRLVMKDWDYLAPLASGEIVAEGIDLELDRKTPIAVIPNDRSIPVGELSLSGFLIRMSQGSRDFVGIPIITTWAFRHRTFFVRNGSNIRSLRDLVGKRIGTNGWSDTGNVWARAALREQGVPISSISWVDGPLEDLSSDFVGHRPNIKTPTYVHDPEPGRTLLEMLLEGDLDALMCPMTPKIFYEDDSPLVRVVPDYRQAERAYYERTGIFPGHHILGIRRELFESDPSIAFSVYDAVDRAKEHWQAARRSMAEFSPWLLADIEETMALMGPDWHPNGVEPNRKMIQALCDEEYAQELIEQPLDGSMVFAEFEKALSEAEELL